VSETAQQSQVLPGVIPYINVDGASDASSFYQKAFAATEVMRMPADDGKRLMHCQLNINGGAMMLSDCFPELGFAREPSRSYTMHLQVADPKAWWDRAVEAGCEVVLPLQVMFWGDRYGQLRDPFGVSWSIGGSPE
jgi:uncharacterized glyoxalase superfamily protein PhnB